MNVSSEIPVTVIKPSSGWSALNLREIWSYRDLLKTLATRDIKIRYKQTSLGVLWVILQQFVSVLIFTLIFGTFAKLPSDGMPYALFSYAGMLCWNMFSGIVSRASNSLLGNSTLITKVYFPRIIIPLSSAMAVMIDFGIALAVMSVLMIYFQVTLTLNILALPFFIILSILIATGASFFLCSINVQYRDFVFVVPFVLQALMYASPIVYSSSLVTGIWKTLYQFNPVVGLVEGFRWCLLGVSSLTWTMIVVDVIVAIVVFIAGAYFFRRFERRFVDVI